MKEFDLAAEQFEKLIAENPREGNLAYLAGQAYEQAGDPDRAIDLFSNALIAMPDNAEVWLARARVLFELGHFHEAGVNARQAADLDPDWFDAFLLKGMAEIQAEEYEKARISLTRATNLDPENPEGWGYLGDALLLSGEEPVAKICYERSLALDPDDSRVLDVYKTCMNNLLDRAGEDHPEEPILDENP
jgi:tetratricopeptide (TPR) repeat protein